MFEDKDLSAMSTEALRACARDLIRLLPDDAVRQLLAEVIRERTPSAG